MHVAATVGVGCVAIGDGVVVVGGVVVVCYCCTK